MAETFRVGTRGSKLALTQTRTVAEALADLAGLEAQLVTIKSEGDVLTGPLSQLGGTGVFAAALRHALFEDQVDVAVHSLKDLPAKDLQGLSIAAVPVRADVRDALCSADELTLEELPEGAKVGTGSPRRAAQLLVARPDLQIVDIRGNVGTRLARVRGREELAEASSQAPDAARGDLDAVVLAGAGLARLGLDDQISELLPPEVMLPAPGQGALAVEVREADASLGQPLGIGLAQLEDIDSRLEVTAERALLARLEAGCAAPIGALARCTAEPDGGVMLRLDAVVVAPDGSDAQRAGAEITLEAGAERSSGIEQSATLGTQVAETLLDEDTGLLKHVTGTH
ncbi:hydroxymethylbilane synthase [Nesterenkonia alkaliphila]|uniref:Porphobilinogen deaminase n=1 Tax=Nesterenkonia alkaliphila TaxID=1463631 RepID=A0A7K1UH10_9MICC|nr:hydroxymethylbilane synthase [Nesterenkonia alkaliphila]MVT25676.1 hydroxymethylbilane synthase [Nesterenkonia alkaliphila]GFZ85028.1 porphobilinogen deaminase [Nesterenkonia alkaliphila]